MGRCESWSRRIRIAGGDRPYDLPPEATALNVYRYIDGDKSNFGDDLNRWMWSRLLGFSVDVEDGTLLLGIGTVIGRGIIPFAKRYIVLSSGVGYEEPPSGFGGPNWEILSVRGPLTAEVLNLPPEKAMIDGAVLLRLLPECEPLPASQRAGIVFMPHLDSLPMGNWRQVCEMAGFEFLDPLAESEETVQRIRRAKLVIADAMHLAIVADALRVPWIPVVISPRTNTFKWLDWTMSLGLPYRPAKIPASNLLEAVQNNSLRFYGASYYLEGRTPAKAIRHYRRLIRLRSSKHWPKWRWRLMKLTYFIPRSIVTLDAFKGVKRRLDQVLIHRAAKQLRRVAEMPPYLSDERLFMSKLEQTANLLPRLRPSPPGTEGPQA